MTSKPNPNKRAQECHKIKKHTSPPPLNFSSNFVKQAQYLDVWQKTLLCKLQNNLPRAPLVTIYKSFIRPHLDYGDDLHCHMLKIFHERLESIQYNAALTITGAKRGSSWEKPNLALGFKTLQQLLLVFQYKKFWEWHFPRNVYWLS